VFVFVAGLTPAHSAALSNNTQVLRCLHWLGSDLSRPELKGGRTVLHLATERGYGQLVQVLVQELGCEVNARTYAGLTPTDLALHKSPSLARELVALGGAALSSLREAADSDSEEEEL